MKPNRVYLFFDSQARLVGSLPWNDDTPPYIVQASDTEPEREMSDDDIEYLPPTPNTVH